MPKVPTPPTFLLIDFENVQPKDLAALAGGDVQVKLFVGSQQTKLSLDLALVVHELGREKAGYIRIAGSGRNALDLHIAYYIGRLSAEHPGARFVILSKDRDYDVLIKHLQAGGIQCRRTGSIDELKPPKAPPKSSPKSPPKSAAKAPPANGHDPVERARTHLRKMKENQPSTLKALSSTLKAQLRGGGNDRDVQQIVEGLRQRGLITVDGNRVRYLLD